MARETQHRKEQQAIEPHRGGSVFRRESERPSVLTPFRLMDSLINDMVGGGSPLRALESIYPQVDMVEQEGKLLIRADLPGVDINNVRATITDDSVIVEGEREEEREHKDRRMYRYERTYGHFRREIPLPDGADTENVNATFKNGVLEITLDMRQAAQAHREIPIQKESAESAESGQQVKSEHPEQKAA